MSPKTRNSPQIGDGSSPFMAYGFGAGRHHRPTDSGEGGSISEKRAAGVGAYGAPPPRSETLQVDQRIDPGAMYMHNNYSRGSVRDEYDYSRKVLRVLNPDDM